MKIFALLMLCAGLSSAPAALYVAPTGSDDNPGTQERPFKSLEGARDYIRKSRLSGEWDGGVTVFLRGGMYRISSTVQFDGRDSGRAGQPVVYRAYPNEVPVFSGGVPVAEWILHDKEKHIYRANVGALDFRQIYVNGELALRARHPNATSTRDITPFFKMQGAETEGRGYRIRKSEWDQVATSDLGALELVVHPHWIHQNARYHSHVVDGDHVWILPREDERAGCFIKNSGYFRNASYYFENALALLDAEHEWFLDRKSGMLYYKPPSGVSMEACRVEVPVVPVLMQLEGRADVPIHDLEFQGLVFECSNWLRPSKRGLAATQFVQPYHGGAPTFDNTDWPQGMVRGTHLQRVRFQGNTFCRAGANGLELYADADACLIEGNQFFDIGATAVVVDKHGEKNPLPERQSVDLVIRDNHIRRAGSVYSNGGGIFAGNVRRMTIENNTLHDLPYSGIQVGQQPGGYNDVGCGDNTIQRNHIYRCMQVHDDGGGIYTLGGSSTRL